jgi:hypothetical protein
MLVRGTSYGPLGAGPYESSSPSELSMGYGMSTGKSRAEARTGFSRIGEGYELVKIIGGKF